MVRVTTSVPRVFTPRQSRVKAPTKDGLLPQIRTKRKRKIRRREREQSNGAGGRERRGRMKAKETREVKERERKREKYAVPNEQRDVQLRKNIFFRFLIPPSSNISFIMPRVYRVLHKQLQLR